VEKLELEPGGELVYTMTATAPAQVEFMRNAGLPLATTSRKRFTDVERPQRLGYMSLVDFVPDTPPYEFLTVVELEPTNGSVQVTMTVDSMHDQGVDGASRRRARERTRQPRDTDREPSLTAGDDFTVGVPS
jgi:hypothetical protein